MALAVYSAAKRWVERPLEPVALRGRGMHVLGFVSRAAPSVPADAEPPPQAGAQGARGARGGAEEEAGDARHGAEPRRHDSYRTAHGNYGSYYGYRPSEAPGAPDPRLAALVERLGKRLFKGLEVLDIGCNAGAVSLAVARRLKAQRVVGVDLDADLTAAAAASAAAASATAAAAAGGHRAQGTVEFRTEDILESPLRRGPAQEPERFDVVLCLSVTKWVHFQHGDRGIRNLFKRCLKRLRPGGLFILEPQNWSSYKKKRYITPEIRRTVAGIELRPEAFDEHLVGVLGFERVAEVAPLSGASLPRGFKRTMHVYRRPREQEEALLQLGEPAQGTAPEEARVGADRARARKRTRAAEEELAAAADEVAAVGPAAQAAAAEAPPRTRKRRTGEGAAACKHARECGEEQEQAPPPNEPEAPERVKKKEKAKSRHA